jgi:hypothetical protein
MECLTIKQLVQLIRTKQMQINSLELTKIFLPKFFISDTKVTKSNITIPIWKYMLNPQSIKLWKLFKSNNIQLNYQFIKYVVDNEYPGTKIFCWLLANTDYINQFLQIYKNNELYDEPTEFIYKPVKFEEFIYDCLRNQEFNKVDIIGKSGYDINSNRLLERIYIEYDNGSDWDIGYLLNLFALKDNFNFDDINSIIKFKLMYEILKKCNTKTIYQYYPNIIANKKIKAYISCKYPESEYQLTKAKLKKYLALDFSYDYTSLLLAKYSGDDICVKTNTDNDDEVIYDKTNKHIFVNFVIGPNLYTNNEIVSAFESLLEYLNFVIFWGRSM